MSPRNLPVSSPQHQNYLQMCTIISGNFFHVDSEIGFKCMANTWLTLLFPQLTTEISTGRCFVSSVHPASSFVCSDSSDAFHCSLYHFLCALRILGFGCSVVLSLTWKLVCIWRVHEGRWDKFRQTNKKASKQTKTISSLWLIKIPQSFQHYAFSKNLVALLGGMALLRKCVTVGVGVGVS